MGEQYKEINVHDASNCKKIETGTKNTNYVLIFDVCINAGATLDCGLDAIYYKNRGRPWFYWTYDI